MTLEAQIHVERATGFSLDLTLTIAKGEVVALLGPNGAGKTTVLRALAGLLPTTRGSIRLGDVIWDMPPDVFLPVPHRPIGVVFDDYRLFDHMSALENVAFGLRTRRTTRRTARERASAWLDRVGLTDQTEAPPPTLSAGQAQRVALARALVTDSEVLLMDEPLAALDASNRVSLRDELGRHIAEYEGHTLLVTHDPVDAIVLADRLVIIEDGRVVQDGPPEELARRPRTDYVARLVGLNLYRGRAVGADVDLDDGGCFTIAEPMDGSVYVAFPPTAVSLYVDAPVGSPRNIWPVRVTGIEHHGHTVRVRMDGRPPVLADVTPAAIADLRLAPGRQLWAALKATETHAYSVD